MSDQRHSASPWTGLFGGLVVFAAFAAYAYWAPATYEATAKIVFDTTGASSELPPPATVEKKLFSAALEAQDLTSVGARLSKALKSPADIRSHLESILVVHSRDSRNYGITVREASAARAQELANVLASRAAAGALLLATTDTAENAELEAERKRRSDRLSAFLLKHPELAAPTISPVASAESTTLSTEAQIGALRAEQEELKKRLQGIEAEKSSDSDNPYSESIQDDVKRLRRRMQEIDTSLARLRGDAKAKSTAKAGPKLDPEVEREWRSLLRAVAEVTASSPAQGTSPSIVARVVPAELPNAPIRPNRKLFLLLGAVLGVLSAITLMLVSVVRARSRAAERQRRDASPRLASDPPGRISEPAAFGSEPPAFGSNPPAFGSNPPAFGSNPPAFGSNPPPFGSNPPPFGSEPPPNGGTSGSEPPARPQQSSEPAARVPSEPPLGTTSSAPPPRAVSSSPPEPPPGAPPQAGAVVASALVRLEPSPIRTPKPEAPPPGAEQPAGVSRTIPPPPQTLRTPGVASVKTEDPGRTITGLSPAQLPNLEPQPSAARAPAPQTSAPRPSGSQPPVPRPSSPVGEGMVVEVTGEAVPSVRSPMPERKRTLAGPFTPQPSPAPAAAPVPAADPRKRPGRTTQMLGSPIPAAVRSSRPPAKSNPPVQTSPPQTPTGYSYVNVPPAPKSPDVALGTPHPSRPPRSERNPAAPKIQTHRVPPGWTPHAPLQVNLRRPLAEQLMPLAAEACFVVGVSAVPELRAQKTHVACELALALAEAQHPRVLLLEGDFHWPALNTVLGVEMPFSAGYSQQLRSRAHSANGQAWSVVECGPGLHVIAEGIMRSPGLILSSHFEDSLRSLRTYYDVIVVDGPLTSSEVDCRALDSLIDGLVLVSPGQGSPWLSQSLALFSEKRFSSVVGVSS